MNWPRKAPRLSAVTLRTDPLWLVQVAGPIPCATASGSKLSSSAKPSKILFIANSFGRRFGCGKPDGAPCCDTEPTGHQSAALAWAVRPLATRLPDHERI